MSDHARCGLHPCQHELAAPLLRHRRTVSRGGPIDAAIGSAIDAWNGQGRREPMAVLLRDLGLKPNRRRDDDE
jgi:hypothetical protein